MMFNHGDYNETFTEIVSTAFEKVEAVDSVMELDGVEYALQDRNQRMAWVEAITELFVRQTGQRPPGAQLERLATFILREELKDRSTGKHRREEYPFLSEQQMRRRQRKSVSSAAAEGIATDGQNHRTPTRRKRMIKEMLHIDETARIRNKERRKKYAEARKPGKVKSYTLKSTLKSRQE